MAAPHACRAVLIFVVDDDEGTRRLLDRLLRKHGYSVRLFEDGVTALEGVSEQPPSLVLTDVNMPRLDGLSLAARLRTVAPEVPVLIMSGEATAETHRAACNLGAAGFLCKPFESVMQLLEIVRDALAGTKRRAPESPAGDTATTTAPVSLSEPWQ
jgi:DNA-binding NtrC family response regulator